MRNIALGVASVALVLVSALVMTWFRPGIGLGDSNGMFGDTALFSALAFALVVLIETGSIAFGYVVPMNRVRWGYGVGATALASALLISYLMPPEIDHQLAPRTWAPLVFSIGVIMGIVVGFRASGGGRDDFAGEYKPVVIARKPGEKLATSPGMKPLAHLRGKLSFAAMTAQLTKAGVEARLEDGEERLVMWRDVIGIVARRMPDAYDAVPFLDLVSTAGATIRLLPWTRFTGEPIDGEPRACAKALLAWCTHATMDPATKQFVEGTGEPAQLPELTTLGAHDEKLA